MSSVNNIQVERTSKAKFKIIEVIGTYRYIGITTKTLIFFSNCFVNWLREFEF